MTEQVSPNIFTAINAIMGQVGYVKKQRSPNLNYTYAGEAGLIGALRPEMQAEGVFVYPEEVTNLEAREYTTKNGATMVNVTLTAKFRFVHAPSGTSISVVARGEGADSGDKANSKAMTCAFKYALRQTFCIETGDDPDNFQPTRKERQPEEPHTEPPAPKQAHDLEWAYKLLTPRNKTPLEKLTTDDLKKLKVSIETVMLKNGKLTTEEADLLEGTILIIQHNEGK